MTKFLLAAVIAIVAICAPLTCGAQVYKCVEGGKTVYQAAPCASSGTTVTNLDKQTREQQLESENRTLREELERRRKAPETYQPPAQAPGRTRSDLRAERANSPECREATRSYDNEAFSQSRTRSSLDSKKSAMNVACGMGF